jgi:hypothetical protein
MSARHRPQESSRELGTLEELYDPSTKQNRSRSYSLTGPKPLDAIEYVADRAITTLPLATPFDGQDHTLFCQGRRSIPSLAETFGWLRLEQIVHQWRPADAANPVGPIMLYFESETDRVSFVLLFADALAAHDERLS